MAVIKLKKRKNDNIGNDFVYVNLKKVLYIEVMQLQKKEKIIAFHFENKDSKVLYSDRGCNVDDAILQIEKEGEGEGVK